MNNSQATESPLFADDISAQMSRSIGNIPAEGVAEQLPVRPVIRIVGGRRWTAFEPKALWHHRDLFYFLVWRDVKVRYRQTALGVIWAILQPLLTMVVFTVLFGKLARVPSDGQPYSIFVYAGLLPWNFFNNAVTNSSNSLVTSVALITKVYFPRLVIPVAAVGAALVDFGVSGVILFLMARYYGIAASFRLLMLLPLTLLLTIFSMAVGMWLSALNVKYRDVRYALPFILNIWMYATPIIYPVSFIPVHWRWILILNPLGGIIQGFRSAIFSLPLHTGELLASSSIVLVALGYAVYTFQRMEKEFADII